MGCNNHISCLKKITSCKNWQISLLRNPVKSYLIRPTLKSCWFPIHRPGEIKNSHEPPRVETLFLQSLCRKRYTTKLFKKDKQLIWWCEHWLQTKFWWSYRKYMQKGWYKVKCTYQSSTIYEYRKKRVIMNAFFCHNLIIVPLLGYSTISC